MGMVADQNILINPLKKDIIELKNDTIVPPNHTINAKINNIATPNNNNEFQSILLPLRFLRSI